MSKKKETILELVTPAIKHFDETHKDFDVEEREEYVGDLMTIIESTVKFEAGLITESELEEIHVELEQRMCGRHHVGGAF
jgi:hypothetical protein